MSVLKGQIAVESEQMTGVVYKGEFYSPLDLALEALDYFNANKIDMAVEVLDLVKECMDNDYMEGYGGIMATVLYTGMVGYIEQQFANRIQKLKQYK